MAQIFLSELFASVQGEGTLTGTPSVFIRTTGCNLRCVWCDTPETSWRPEGTHVDLETVIARVEALRPLRHAVITGGEPLIAKGVPELARALHERGFHITVETAGTVFQDMPVDLYSISPKLANSTPGPEHGTWHERHEATRIDTSVIRAMMEAADYQLKFVVAGEQDVEEILALIEDLPLDRADRVHLMPEARTARELDERAGWVVAQCLTHGFRYCDRLHIRLFGNTRGT